MPVAVVLSLLSTAHLVAPYVFESDPPSQVLTAKEHAEQLKNCRDGILDHEARSEDRRRWANNLFTYDSPQAKAIMLELLVMDDRPEVQRTICAVMAEKASAHPDRLSPDYVDALMRLLSAQNDELRSSAARALAEFPQAEVAGLLGSLAGDAAAPLPTRMAAIDALAPSTHRREVVSQLVALLDLQIPAITEKVVAALEPIAPLNLSAQPQLWRDWWDTQRQLTAEEWLESQVRIYRDRSRRVTAELNALKSEREQETAAMVARVGEFQRDLLRNLQPEQRDARLVEWLDDSLNTVKLGALSIVKSRIADEGKRPEGDLLAAVLRRLKNANPAIRREVLLIAQNVQAELVVDPVLAQLKQETDASVRQVIFDTLGKLGTPAAVPALLLEISAKSSDAAGVRDAATALGQIGMKVGAQGLEAAIVPLQERYRQTTADEVVLRGALLAAMAGVGAPVFASEFAEALGSEDPRLLQPAIQGLAAIGDGAKLARIRSLAPHPDPRVRLAAVEAISKLGGSEADAAALLGRVAPAVEANESVRLAAWRGWKDLCARRGLADRVAAADGLRELPELQQSYLIELAAALAASGNHHKQLAEVQWRISQLLMASGKNAEAVPYLRDLFASPGEVANQGEVGLKWLDAVLQSPGQQGLADVIGQLCKTEDPEIGRQIVAAIRKYVDSQALATDSDRARRFLADLRTIDPALVGDGWNELLQQIDASVKPLPTTPNG